MKIKGICYKIRTNTYMVKKDGVYIGSFFTFESAKQALEEWINWRDE